jgi:hypothetical protein
MAKRNGGDSRGNSTARRKRKEWLLSPESGFGGDGQKVPCVHCGRMLDYSTVESDRKEPGGPYARFNVQPADRFCNASRSNNVDWVSPLMKSA